MSDVDMINHPPHYGGHPSGIECIQITRRLSFSLGNAVKYVWRADSKHSEREDLLKAEWYLNDVIASAESFDVESPAYYLMLAVADRELHRHREGVLRAIAHADPIGARQLVRYWIEALDRGARS